MSKPSNKDSKNFRFWIPLDKIEKAVGKDGKQILRLGGIASTARKDTDGETLDPTQFDTTYLEEKGIINWNHSKSPEAVIGEPTKIEFRKAGMYVESELYPESELAQKVYGLAEVLKKNSKRRRLGYSVEGKAITRDPLDPTKIGKAMITNLALTISPKNPDSIVDIIKGDFHEFSDEDLKKGEVDPLFDITANGGNTSEIALDLDEGDYRIIVNKDMSVKIVKKSLNTESGKATMPEHVDGQPKKVIKPEDEDEVEKCGNVKYLSKAEVFDKIFDCQPVINIDKANELYESLNTLAMSNTKITDDLLQKSLVTLGLSKTSASSKIQKGEGVEEEENEEENEEAGKKKVKKSMTGTTTPSKGGAAGANGGKENIQKGAEEDEEDDEEEEEEKPAPKKKAKKPVDNMEKSNDATTELIKSLAVIAKGTYDLQKANNELLKSIKEDMSGVSEGITKSLDSIELLGAQPQNGGRKSVAKAAERQFNNAGDEINKGIEGGALENQANTLSISRNKTAIVNLLDEMTFSKGFDNELAGAMTTFEASSFLAPSAIARLKSEKGIVIVQ